MTARRRRRPRTTRRWRSAATRRGGPGLWDWLTGALGLLAAATSIVTVGGNLIVVGDVTRSRLLTRCQAWRHDDGQSYADLSHAAKLDAVSRPRRLLY